MIQIDRKSAFVAAGGVVAGLLLSLAVTAPGRALDGSETRQQAAALAALTAEFKGLTGRIETLDTHLAGIGTKAQQIDDLLGSLSAAFSMGDPKLLALYERLGTIERALAEDEGMIYLPATWLTEPDLTAEE